MNIVNIVLVLLLIIFLLPKFYSNIMTFRDVKLCANLHKKPKPI